MDANDNVDNSCRTVMASKRIETSQIFENLKTMVPDMSADTLAKIHESAVSMLALARQEECELIGNERRERQLNKSRRVPLLEATSQKADEINMTTIKDLPEEVLLEIMTHLNLADRKRTRLVSKQWHRLSYDKRLIKNDVLKIKAPEYLYHITPDSSHINLIVYECRYLARRMPFWRKHGGEIEAIDFKNVIDSNVQALVKVLRSCPNVERLSVRFTQHERHLSNISFPVIPLPYLKRLKLWSATRFVALNIDAPKLKEVVCDAPVMANAAFSKLMVRQGSIIEKLDVTETDDEEVDIARIVDTFGSQLKRLHLRVNREVSDSRLDTIVRKFVNLEHLSLINAYSSISAVENAVTSLKSLTHLSLEGINLSDAPNSFFIAIDNWTHLIAIDLRRTYVNAENLKVAFRSPHPAVINLQLDARRDLLENICPNLPNLLALGLHGDSLGERDLQVIARCNTQLEDLSIHSFLSEDLIAVNNIKTLVHLTLVRCRNCADFMRALSLSKLQTIRLSLFFSFDIIDITSEVILHLVENNPLLHRVEVMHSGNIVNQNVITNEIRDILQRRTPVCPSKRPENIFSWPGNH